MGTPKEARGKRIDEVGFSCYGDFEDSPFSNFVEEWVNFFLGAIEELFESLKGKKVKEMVHKNQKFLEESEERTAHKLLKEK